MPRWNKLLRPLLFILSLTLVPIGVFAQQPGEVPQAVDGPLTTPIKPAMTNESVMKMARAGLGDDLIIETINTQPGKYVTDADALITLKSAGVSDRVIPRLLEGTASYRGARR